jgi:hypothetical protein
MRKLDLCRPAPNGIDYDQRFGIPHRDGGARKTAASRDCDGDVYQLGKLGVRHTASRRQFCNARASLVVARMGSNSRDLSGW